MNLIVGWGSVRNSKMSNEVYFDYLLNDLKRGQITKWDIEFVEELRNREQDLISISQKLISLKGTLKSLGASNYDLQQIDDIIKLLKND